MTGFVGDTQFFPLRFRRIFLLPYGGSGRNMLYCRLMAFREGENCPERPFRPGG